jgi:hypothetical protein
MGLGAAGGHDCSFVVILGSLLRALRVYVVQNLGAAKHRPDGDPLPIARRGRSSPFLELRQLALNLVSNRAMLRFFFGSGLPERCDGEPR